MFAKLRLIKTPGEVQTLVALAEQDQHGIAFPTHLIEKEERMAGYFSIAGVPLVLCWLSTKELKARDSFQLINSVENIGFNLPGTPKVFLTAVPKKSPFHRLLPKMGYKNVGSYDLFTKEA